MNANEQKEAKSKALVRLIAADAGVYVGQPETDFDSVDLRFAERGSRGVIRSPQLEAQIKCTSLIDLHGSQPIRYALKVKNYNDLRMEDFAVERILIVVAVPDESHNWLQYGDQGILLQSRAYWLSLRGYPATENSTTVTISIDREQTFTPEALLRIMTRISQKEKP